MTQVIKYIIHCNFYYYRKIENNYLYFILVQETELYSSPTAHNNYPTTNNNSGDYNFFMHLNTVKCFYFKIDDLVELSTFSRSTTSTTANNIGDK